MVELEPLLSAMSGVKAMSFDSKRTALRNEVARWFGRLLGTAGISILLAVGSGVTARAQSPIQSPFPSWPSGQLEPAAIGPLNETVFRRPRPDYDPLGVRMGSFLFFPSGTLTGTYDSNVFAVQSGVKSDFYVGEHPSLNVRSDWNLHAIGFSASGDFKQYASLSTENVNNGSAELVGRYDIANAEYFSGDAIYQLGHEDRSSPNAAFGKNPTEYHLMGFDFAYVRQPGRLGLRIDANLTTWDYNNATNGVTGATINQNFRDRNEWVIAPRLSYEIIPGYQAFVRLIGNERQYFSQELGAGPQGQNVRRNSHGWEIDGGTAIALTSITTAEVYVGYLQQDYENPLIPSVSAPSFGGNLIWNVTPITTVRASFSASVAETTLVLASSSYEYGAQLTVEHELLRNLLLLGSAGYVRDDYQGNPRKDNTFGANAGARYLLNRNWSATTDLTFSRLDSNVAGGGYDRFIGTVGVKAGF
jgi:hypothetical protein